jgi:hypothetical protein
MCRALQVASVVRMTSLNPLATVLGRVQAWSVESQLGARRNAMVATTALTARRAEREDAEAFIAGLQPREQVLSVAVSARR